MLRIQTLPIQEAIQAQREYNQKQYSKTSAYICRWFGFYRLYTGQPLLWILFILSFLLIIPGLVRWIIDAFQVGAYVNQKNQELDDEIFVKYNKDTK